MPTTRLALPYPADTDLVMDGNEAIQSLAEALDDLVPAKARRGVASANVDASGDITITHGLGATPTVCLVSDQTNTQSRSLGVHTFTSTTFKVRFRVSNTAAVVAAGTAVVVHWSASV